MRWSTSLCVSALLLSACGTAADQSASSSSFVGMDLKANKTTSTAGCGTPQAFGDLQPNDVICHRPVVPVHISGALTVPVQIAFQAPDGSTTVGAMDRSGNSCNFQYQWRPGHDPLAGLYQITVSDANNVVYSFSVTVGDNNKCNGAGGTDTTSGSTSATTGGGASTTTGGTDGSTTSAGATTGGASTTTGGTVTTGGTDGTTTTTGGTDGTTTGGTSTTGGTTTGSTTNGDGSTTSSVTLGGGGPDAGTTGTTGTTTGTTITTTLGNQ